jgi:hypothetical protein
MSSSGLSEAQLAENSAINLSWQGMCTIALILFAATKQEKQSSCLLLTTARQSAKPGYSKSFWCLKYKDRSSNVKSQMLLDTRFSRSSPFGGWYYGSTGSNPAIGDGMVRDGKCRGSFATHFCLEKWAMSLEKDLSIILIIQSHWK